VKAFVTHEGIIKHSVAQFRDMMSDNHRIEYNYIESFQTVASNLERMPPHQPLKLMIMMIKMTTTMTLLMMLLTRTTPSTCAFLINTSPPRNPINTCASRSLHVTQSYAATQSSCSFIAGAGHHDVSAHVSHKKTRVLQGTAVFTYWWNIYIYK
jgi:hypothetical protein